jgi:hypothetical protein
LQVGEVGDEGGLTEDLLRGEMVEIVRVREGLDKLYEAPSRQSASVEPRELAT